MGRILPISAAAIALSVTLVGTSMLPLFAQAYPTLPTFVQVGKLSCAARMYTETQVQSWCTKGKPPQLVYNSLATVVNGAAVSYFIDQTPSEEAATMIWIFKYNQTTGKIDYQATYLTGDVNLDINNQNNPVLNGTL